MHIANSLSVDLESFVHREFNLRKRHTKDNGFTIKATSYLLDLLDAYNTKITFFVVGEIYEWYPELIEKIKLYGHEIAYHSHRHIILSSKELLIQELELSKRFIKKYSPIGFRAPRLYIKKEYFRILSDFGFKYDSSVYGLSIFHPNNDSFLEIPVSTFNLFGEQKIRYPQNLHKAILKGSIPYGSGLMIGFFQKKIQNFINIANKNKKPAILLVHPWQFFHYPIDLSIESLLNIPKLMYRRRVNSAVEYLLSKNKFVPLREIVSL